MSKEIIEEELLRFIEFFRMAYYPLMQSITIEEMKKTISDFLLLEDELKQLEGVKHD